MSEHEQAQEASHPHDASEGQTSEGTVKPLPSSEASSPKKFQPIHFLVADDNRVNRKVFTMQINRLGHDCDLVEHGEEAVDAYRKGHHAYQCILMDVSMPVMGGIEAMKLIRAFEEENSLKPGLIVALTAGTLSAESNRLKKFGFTTVLKKPFHLVGLSRLLEELDLLHEI